MATRLGTRPIAPRATCSSWSIRLFGVMIATLCPSGTRSISDPRHSPRSMMRASAREIGSRSRVNSSLATEMYDFDGASQSLSPTTAATHASERSFVRILATFRVWPTADQMRARCDPRVDQVGSRLSSWTVEPIASVRYCIRPDSGLESAESLLLPEPTGHRS